MIKHSLFNSYLFLKKPFFYILMFLSLALAFGMVAIKHFFGSGLGSMSLVWAIPFFVVDVLLVIFIAAHFFYWGESSGMELLSFSKPLLRTQIVTSKFISSIFFILIFHFYSFIVIIIATQTDSSSTGSAKASFAGSIALGGIIVSLILLAIVILLVMVFKNFYAIVAVFAIGTAILPTISIALAVAGRANKYIDGTMTQAFLKFDPAVQDVKKLLDNDSSEYKGLLGEFKLVSERKNVDPKKSVTNWYSAIPYIDIWQQWGWNYSMFSNIDTSDTMSPVKYQSANKTYELEKNHYFILKSNFGNTRQDFAFSDWISQSGFNYLNVINPYVARHENADVISVKDFFKEISSDVTYNIFPKTSIGRIIFDGLFSNQLDLFAKIILFSNMVNIFNDYAKTKSNVNFDELTYDPNTGQLTGQIQLGDPGNTLKEWLHRDYSDKAAKKLLNEGIFKSDNQAIISFNGQNYSEQSASNPVGVLSASFKNNLKLLYLICFQDLANEYPTISNVSSELNSSELEAIDGYVLDGENLKHETLVPRPYLNNKIVVPVWLVISILSIAGVFVFYRRKDFR